MRVLSAIVLALLALGCSKSPGSTDGGPLDGGTADGGPLDGGSVVCTVGAPAPVSAGTFCDQFIGALCDEAIRCKFIGLSRDACIGTYQTGVPECDRGVLASGGVDVSPAAGCCLAAIQANDCTGAAFSRMQETCNGSALFVPKLALGAACTLDEECIPADGGSTGCYRGETWTSCGGTCTNGQPVGSPCDDFYPGAQCLSGWCRIDAGYQGVCAPFTALGAACSGPTCDADSFCDTTQAPAVCAPRMAMGQACASESCVAGLHCSSGTCRGAAGDGGACDPNDARSCSYPLGCYGGICKPAQYLPGDACSMDGGNPCADSLCTPSASGDTCQPFPGLGEPCTEFCTSPYQCTAGACVALADVGEACSSLQCRWGLYCASGTCVADPDLGEHCGDPGSMCRTGYCDAASQTCKPWQAPFGPCTDDLQCADAYDANLCRDIPPDGGSGYCNTCEPLN
ncbi:MAG: hypothetical protein JST54_01140 [Deltaproteobacteria bacterium]|nr:hypothetical protein [Deltaproteobacteria bacterium]